MKDGHEHRSGSRKSPAAEIAELAAKRDDAAGTDIAA